MPLSWTANTKWSEPIKREICGRISDSFISCTHPKPCPVHDKKGPELVYDRETDTFKPVAK